jgi:hypothetical protein
MTVLWALPTTSIRRSPQAGNRNEDFAPGAFEQQRAARACPEGFAWIGSWARSLRTPFFPVSTSALRLDGDVILIKLVQREPGRFWQIVHRFIAGGFFFAYRRVFFVGFVLSVLIIA